MMLEIPHEKGISETWTSVDLPILRTNSATNVLTCSSVLNDKKNMDRMPR